MKARVFSLKELIDKDAPAARQAESIDAELNRLKRLVQDFLDYARPSQPFLEEVNLTKFLQEMHTILTPEMAAQGHAFHLEVSELPTVSIDTQQMRQVIFNLTLNAAEACTGRKGKLVLGAKLIKGCPTIFISDNGPGIPDEYRDQLFTPFFSKKSAGTGLGLSIVQSLARKQGARLYFETEPDVGTAFFVELKPI